MTSSYQPDALELVRALVRDKTRFEPADLQPAGGADSFQPLLLSARYSLAARRASGAINGASFAPADDDVRSASVATVESDADWEDHGRLAQAQDLLARQLAADGSAWDAIGDGVYLGHHRRHWHLASCEACHGRGRVECATCHGSRAVPCDACAGGGRMRCPDCPPGNRKCPTCHGSKQVACGECLGDGAVACGACAGAGEVQCAPCAGSGRYGLAAWVDIHLGVEYNLALPDTADADVRAIAAAGPHAIAAVAHTLVLRHVEPGAGGQLRADYALQLRVVRQDVACNGHVYQLLAYGYPLTLHTLGGIVEDLLRHDLQALDHALGAAKRQGWLATDTGALLPPLHAVTASALNLEVAEALLDGTQTHGAVVSSNYADELRTTVLGALRQVHARVARRTWWHGALAATLATVAAWAWSQLPWGLLAGAAVTAGAWLLFRRRVRVLLTQAPGGRKLANRTIALARRGQRQRVAATLIVAPALLALAGLGVLLPWQGPLAPHQAGMTSGRAATHGAVKQGAIASSAQRAAVAPVLARYAAGELAAARRALAALAQRGNAAAWGPYGWMVLQGEGLNAQQLAAPDSASAARRQQARPWIAKGLEVGDLWAQAAQGALQLDQQGGDREQAIFLLTMAAKRQHAPAMQALGTAYREGRHVARDDTAARTWLTEAADLGRPSAQYQLGVLDWYGLGGQRPDKTRAMALWRQAAAAGDLNAARALRAGRPD